MPELPDGTPAYCAAFFPLNFGGQRGDGSTTLRRDGACVHSNFFGQSSFATYAICRPRGLVKLADDVPFDVAAPLGCGIQTGAGAVLNVLRVPAGAALVVLGTGGVGMSAVMAGRLCGAGIVVAVDPVASRRELAVELGADAALDPRADDFEASLGATARGGFDFAVDTSGQPSVITQGPVADIRNCPETANSVTGRDWTPDLVRSLSADLHPGACSEVFCR